ncbi:extracellular solute-binding protein, partial [Bradyrhizobium sp.]|uniref:extracellular solute-binding protein n=1 Tax=Bradyrhizobium sp. TaxID=376 RepID=UPI0025C7386F
TAITLLMGGRSDVSMVRPGATEAVVEARFDLPTGEHILRRVIPAAGRSRSYIDGRLATRAELAEFGAQLVDEKGNVTVKTDAVRQALEFYKKLISFLPPDVAAWDDASNNKWLVSGRGAMIMNPPSAWAVAKRDAPQVAEQCWTHGFPAGPKGRFAPYLPYFWSIWNFSKNKEAAKSLLVQLSKPAAIEKMVNASGGYDLPAYEKLTTLKVWQEEGPPKGTLYHYPNPYKHQTLSIAASPAPPKIAQQIYAQATLTKMCLRYHQGEAMEKTLAWAEGECEGFMRG